MIALLLALAPAQAGLLQLSGFVSPQFTGTVRPNAVPEDRLNAGLSATRAGITFSGEPDDRWAFKTYLLVGGDTFAAVTGVSTVDTNNDGDIDRVSTTTQGALGQIVREASVTFQPVEVFGIRVGRMPIPFTSQAQSPDTALLFPQRSGPNTIFLADDDLGGLLELDVDGVVLASAGLFNGTGVGGGLVWNPYTSYDSAGYEDVNVSDFRGSASVRMAVAGFSVSGEVLRRYQIDDLTHRPVEATGAYGQAGWLLEFGLEPIFRMGWVAEDQSFDPRTTIWTDAGMNIYPGFDGDNPDAVRFTLQYLSENRVTEQEVARGISARAQVKW